MTVKDLVELSLFCGLVVLALLMLGSLVLRRPSDVRGTSWKDRLRRFLHFTLVRLPIALGIAIAVFILGLAALTLNSHRPPGDNSPIVTVPSRSGTGQVDLRLTSCSSDAKGYVRYSGKRRGRPVAPRVFSDQDGLEPLRLKRDGSDARGSFEITDPLVRRGLLSCYLQMPVMRGAEGGYEVHLKLNDVMEVDMAASVPPPDEFNHGEWIWNCPPAETCPGFAAINYSVEDGTKQLIILVLASVFGALIALLVGEVLIDWAKRRRKPRPDA